MCPTRDCSAPHISLHHPTTSRRLCAVLRPAGGYFFAYVRRAGRALKKQNRRKGHLQARHGVLRPYGYPYIPAPQNGPQKPPEAHAWHKLTPAHSTRSKPGYYHLFRARDRTAQRSLSASHQAQNFRAHSISLSILSFFFGLIGRDNQVNSNRGHAL